ncbi:MAG: alpha amylase C-terminal domain-containing protein, partial [Acidimicrobiales bacterium]
GWMHDTLEYFSADPVHRRYRHDEITFRGVYAFSENYVLPLSHDEVTHGKGSILARMPGDEWQEFANLRVLYANQWLNPGKKLMFMGQEFGQGPEWNHDLPLPWDQLGTSFHQPTLDLVAALNALYRAEPALHRNENNPAGFAWIVLDDAENSVLVWQRSVVREPIARPVICVFNQTPVPRPGYSFGVSVPGDWEVLLTTDEGRFGGSDAFSSQALTTSPTPTHGREHRLSIDIPPLSAVVLAPI